MKTKIFLLTALFLNFFGCTQNQEKLNYPVAHKGEVIDSYFGTEVADPYRWMENVDSALTKEWIEAQNEVANNYLSKIPFREKLEKRLTDLWNYEKFTTPRKVSDYYIFSKNDGLQEQYVVYKQEDLETEPTVFLDPNKLSEDGSVSLGGTAFSKDGKLASYSISRGGSDWREIYVMDVENNKQLDDHVKWAKFTGMAWYKDGFFYSRYDEPVKGEELKGQNQFHKLFYHKAGTPQSEDKLILEDKNNSQLGFGAQVTDDEKYLVVTGWMGSASENILFYKNLETDSPIKRLIKDFEAEYIVIDNLDDKFLVLTNYEAPNKKLVLLDPANADKENWEVIIPESKNVLEGVSYVGGKLFASYLEHANSRVVASNVEGEELYTVELPGIGSVYGFGGNREDTELFYSFTSFTYPTTIYKYDVKENKSEVFRKPDVKFNPEDYITNQIFYSSKDGTQIPLFITHKKGLELNGKNPTLLYAYGGFNAAMTPSFRLTIIPLLENNGVYAMACIRGGSEYGEEWHKAGMLGNKQNVFDDYIAGAEYLIENNYTSPEYLAAQGGSNGGTLVGAVINQRPDLFQVAFPMVGVMDMLRFHLFTIGWAWVPEYGSSEDSTQFDFLYAYSPIHNIKSGINYPATMVTTADHDDRVFPAHSFKYAATLQEKNTGDRPAIIRIETKVGHGAGTSTSKTISLYAEMFSFMFYNMGLEI